MKVRKSPRGPLWKPLLKYASVTAENSKRCGKKHPVQKASAEKREELSPHNADRSRQAEEAG